MLQLSSSLAVAPDGRVLVPGTPAFERHVGYRRPDFDLAGYAARNMGYLTLSWTGDHSVDLHFRPSLLTAASVEAISRLLLRAGVKHVELRYLADGADSSADPRFGVLLARLGLLASSQEGLAIRHQRY